MYIFRTLIFVGIISLSTCRPEIQSLMQTQEQQLTKPNVLLNCPDLHNTSTMKQQFNVTAYFRDVYVISSFKPQMRSNKSEDKTVCIQFTSQALENGNVREFYTQLNDPMPDSVLEMIFNPKEFQNGIGKFIAQTRFVDKEGNTKHPFYPVGRTILKTDYSNYAVEHKCIPLSKDVLLSIYLILSRKPVVLDSNYEPILNKLELKLQDFTLLTKPDCAEV